jgi:cell division protein FtsI (penicillin-binding protein 3)
MTANSMAMGYEVSVTPVQLAAAYAVFANGGELVEPTLIKEVRRPDGVVVYRHQRRVVRRVISPSTAARIRQMLQSVVDSGTAVKADLSTYMLAGKTGTPRATVGGRYAPGHYNPNFVGLFPGDAPQYVIVVKLANPGTSIFGGSTAAPVTRAVIEAAIAARDAALDRGRLASSVRIRPAPIAVRPTEGSATAAGVVNAPAGELVAADDVVEAEPVVTSRPLDPPAAAALFRLPVGGLSPAVPAEPLPIPSLDGLSLRQAVRSLHMAGFRVRLERGSVVRTVPAAGALLDAGSTVKLHYPF